MRNRIAITTLVCTVLAAGLIAAPAQAYDGGAATPQELVAQLQKAAEEGDLGGIAACLAPEDRAGMSFGLLLATSMMSAMGGLAADLGEGFSEAFEDGMTEEDQGEADAEMEAMREKTASLMARLETAMEKYGVAEMMEDDTPMPGLAEGADPTQAITAAFADVDQIGLIRELSAILDELSDGEGDGMTGSMPEGDLENLEIEGDQGTATLGGEPLELVRIDGRWFLHAPQGAGTE